MYNVANGRLRNALASWLAWHLMAPLVAVLSLFAEREETPEN